MIAFVQVPREQTVAERLAPVFQSLQDFANGSITIHVDADGVIRKIEKHQIEYRT